LILQTLAEFGAYTAEILRAEGFNEFQVESPSDRSLTIDYLNRFDVVILTETKLNAAQRDLFSDYVHDGGNLIAFRPDKQLASVLGISNTGSKIAGGYIRMGGDSDIGKDLPSDTLQFHGDADQYDLKGAAVVAALFRDARTSTGSPAVIKYAFGKGHAIAFTYNLPKSIVLARQGNELYAGLEKDGIKGVRAADMFADGWVDPSKAGVNQTDEQMRLLSHAIESLSAFKKPLPRLWYFPGLNMSLVLLTGDGEESSESDFDNQLADIKSRGARMTLYLKGTYIPVDKVQRWVAEGFEISSHVDDTQEAIHPGYEGMNDKVKSTVRAFKETYGLEVHTVRNHWITWCGTDADGQPDFTAQASIEARHGIGLDCNFYHYDQDSNQGHFLGPIGNFTGSGLPMKFINRRGQILDVYQSLTQLPDEQWGKDNLFRNFAILLDRSLDREAYTVINVNLHTDRWNKWSRAEGLHILDYANSRSVPIWTAERTLKFFQARNAAEFVGLSWFGNKLSFELHAPIPQGMTLMIPRTFRDTILTSVSRDEENQSYTFRSIKGIDYALVPTTSGNHRFVVTYSESKANQIPVRNYPKRAISF
jgi:hypothetical protein